jgi:hypothetical protein
MKALDRQSLDTVNETQSNPALPIWRSRFTPEVVSLS